MGLVKTIKILGNNLSLICAGDGGTYPAQICWDCTGNGKKIWIKLNDIQIIIVIYESFLDNGFKKLL